MTAEQCIAFLEALRVTQIRVKDNGWVEGTCPLARWTHKGHKDSKPSFGLNINPGGRSYFMCFACRQGSAEELVQVIEMYSHNSSDYNFAVCHALLTDEEYVTPLPPYGEFQKPAQVFIEWPQYWLDSFQRVEWVSVAYDYLQHRGVSPTIMKLFDLRYDAKRGMVVAPYWDVFGRLAGARGRAIEDVDHKHFDYSFQGVNNARLVWYHEQALNLDGPVVVVEGQFDVWKTSQIFPKTVAALTSKPTLEKMKKLGDCGTVIQIPDRDEAGHLSIPIYARHCQQLHLKHQVIYIDEGAKDPDDCAVEYLRDKIQEAMQLSA